jgi:hypothetical protein
VAFGGFGISKLKLAENRGLVTCVDGFTGCVRV